MSPRRIHFGVCGIGLGHAARSTAIIKALRALGWSVSVSSYGEGLEYLRRNGIEARSIPRVGYGVLHEGKVSIKMTIYRNKFLPIRLAEQVAYELSLIEEHDVDLVISDTRVSTVIAARLIRKPTMTILNQFNIRIDYPRYRWIIEGLEAALNLVGWIWARSDRILVSDYPPPLTISKHSLVLPEKVMGKARFIGPMIDRRPEELPETGLLRERYGVEGDGRSIILFQASGPIYERRILVEKILPLLEKLTDKYEVIVTLGGMKPEENSPSSLKIFEWVREPLELVKLADAVICRAGQTTLAKALAYGKPVITIPIPAHAEQLGNARSVEENGAGLILEEERLEEKPLRKAVETVLSREFRKAAARYTEAFRSLRPVEAVVEEAEAMI